MYTYTNYKLTPAVTGEVRVEIPHAEFHLNVDSVKGINIQPFAGYISATAYDQRLLLGAGYHRTFAFIDSHRPDAIDLPLVVALTTDADFMLSAACPNQGVRDMVRGLRPPTFADFFDARLAMPVRLRKKRFEMWIHANLVSIDA